MSSIPSVSPATTQPAAGTTPSSGTVDRSILSKDDFLKLFIAQMSNQDPTSASSNDPNQMMQTMSQFSIIEQLTNLNTAIGALTLSEKATEAASMLGKTVSYADPSDPTGNTIKQGVVDKVLMSGKDVQVKLNGVALPVPVSALTEIDNTSSTTTTGTATTP